MAVQDRLGYFGPFMRAWGTAGAALRAQLYTEALEYQAHLIEPRAYVGAVSTQLGIPYPTAA